jgi:hypothetical protein
VQIAASRLLEFLSPGSHPHIRTFAHPHIC